MDTKYLTTQYTYMGKEGSYYVKRAKRVVSSDGIPQVVTRTERGERFVLMSAGVRLLLLANAEKRILLDVRHGGWRELHDLLCRADWPGYPKPPSPADE